MNRLFWLLGPLLVATTLLAQETGGIDGEVIDRDTRQAIIGARVEVLGTKLGATTDLNGNFRITGLPIGTYRLKITAPEYKTIARSDVRVGSTQSAKLVIELKIDAYQQAEQVITSERTFEKSEDMRVSANVLTQEEIRRAPGAVEDVSRMMQILPGVAFGSDARNDIIARGGSPIENFIMIDGIEVPNINHFSQQGASGGPIGMVNADFLSEVNFSAGGFGAKYGDRLSSIMDIKYREGDKRKTRGKFELGLGGFGGTLESPLQTEQSSMLFSLRRSYLDLVAGGTGLTGIPNYWNLNFKATYRLSSQHSLALLGLGGIDEIELKDYKSDANQAIANQDSKFQGWRYVAGVSHKWLIDETAFLQTSVSTNAYRNGFFADSVALNANGDIVFRERGFHNFSTDRELVVVRSDFSKRISPRDLLELGAIARRLESDMEIFAKANIDVSLNAPEVRINALVSATKLGAYLQYSRSVVANFSVTTGLRWDYFDYIDSKHALSPRLSASYELSPQLRFNLGGGLYQQAPPLIWLVGDQRNRQVKWLKAYQAVAGVEFFPSEDLKFSVEVFAKEYRDYPISVRNPQYVYSNVGADYAQPYEHIRAGSNGYARGIEFFVHKKLSARFYGMCSYSFSRIVFVDGFGEARPSGFDYRHLFTVIGGYKITNSLELSAKFRYAGGRPYTPFDLATSQTLNRGIWDFGLVNRRRLPDYKRLDIRLDQRFALFGWNVIAFVDLQNVLNVENVEQVVWNQKRNAPDRILQWRFLPVGGVRAEF
ncbi:MAG: TonB-dependent receptor [Chloroherpetonaceae bacterium]|nr:TonB-dependent receptor [Chloroherpetonaceae bacterium]MDW8436781.1 TonB-dependent receptor [Chloroherpetonaceae bacterium]